MLRERIIIAPVSSEKATLLRDEHKYVFRVHPDANKFEIKDAVAKLFGVTVLTCNVVNVRGKMKRVRYRAGRSASWKKAVVKIAADQTIKVFEGV